MNLDEIKAELEAKRAEARNLKAQLAQSTLTPSSARQLYARWREAETRCHTLARMLPSAANGCVVPIT